MKDILSWLQIVAAAVGGFASWFFGENDGLITVLIVFIIADYVSGVLRAIVEKKVSSSIGGRGISKKVVIFILVGIAHMVDVEVLGAGDVIRNTVIFFYLSNEGISILENAIALGLPIPKKLKSSLLQIKEKGEMKNDEY
jgi:toxin secretion/phage lysis holin